MSTQHVRILTLTLGLAAAGAIVGALTAIGGIGIIVGVRMGSAAILDATALFPWVGRVGAKAGAVLFPIAVWSLLRHVRLGQALLALSIASVLGALAGEWWRPFNPYSHILPGFVLGAIVGAALGVILLRVATGHVRDLYRAV